MRILIIEDEARIAKRIERLLRSILGKELTAIHQSSTLEEGLHFLAHNTIDLLCLDLNLNEEDGFEVLQQLTRRTFQTVIISAYRNRAIQAFEYGVLDFVPKPFTEARLTKAIQRYKEQKSEEDSLKYLAVKRRGRQTLLPISEIRYVKGAGVYVELHLRNGQMLLHNKSLDSLQQLLPPTFERIHKSYLVYLPEAREIAVEPGSRYTLVLANGEQIPIGRTKYKGLRNRWFND